jgi:oligopeptide/dipeptide ABC transporter ATP-binding protein
LSEYVLEVKNLKTRFFTQEGSATAVDDVSFRVKRGGTLGIVGESGCGKSVSALSIMRLVPDPPGKIVGGEILFEGKDLLKLPMADMRKIRGHKISMIFQEPMTSLNPVFTVGFQIMEAVELHQPELSKKQVRERAIEMLDKVGIPSPKQRIDDYPHQLSGGMRQRVMIAMALSCNPSVLIADEPTTALDVTIQAQILDLMNRLQEEFGTAIIMITHDLGVVAETCEDVVVMYAGKVVEQGTVLDIFQRPKHPYTQGLLNSIPNPEKDISAQGHKARFQTIPGIVPSLLRLPDGCRYQDRCPLVKPSCRQTEPPLEGKAEHHDWACFEVSA